jgi:hypothetical protein
MTPERLTGPVLQSMLELMSSLDNWPENLPLARRRWSAFRRSLRTLAESMPPLWADLVLHRIYSTTEYRVFQARRTEAFHQTTDYRVYKREYMREYMRARRSRVAQ